MHCNACVQTHECKNYNTMYYSFTFGVLCILCDEMLRHISVSLECIMGYIRTSIEVVGYEL